MGLFLRKSLKIGNVKFNLSKSGVGVSVGVKGLRAGIDSKGKTYISGGSKGIFFRENLTSSKKNYISKDIRKNQNMLLDDNIEIKKSKETSTVGCGNVFLIIMFIVLGLLWKGFFFIAIVYVLVLIVINIYNKYEKEKINNLKDVLINLINNNDYEKIKIILKKLDIKIKNTKQRQNFLLDIYKILTMKIFEDGVMSNDEEEVLKVFLSHIPKNVIADINISLVNEILQTVILDKKITIEEEELLNRCISIFNLQNIRNEIENVINDYKKLEEIEKIGLLKIQPETNISDSSDCYYEGQCTILKQKMVKGEKCLMIDYSGKLLITRDNIHIVGNGHRLIKVKDIVKVEMGSNNKIIEIIVNNRKSSIFIEVEKPISVLAILRSIMNLVEK